MKDEFGMPIINWSKTYAPKIIADYIKKNRVIGADQEFRITIDANGDGIIHEMNKDCETGIFEMMPQQ